MTRSERLDGEAAGRQTDVERGRSAVHRSAWGEAFEALNLADQAQPLEPEDLHRLATAAYLVGRVSDCLAALRRAYEAHLRAGQPRPAARAAFWTMYVLGTQRDGAQAGAWLARAQEALRSQPPDCAEQSLVIGAVAFQHLNAGEYAQAQVLAAQAAEIGRHAGDADARGLALTQAGAALVKLGRVSEAMAVLDEAMVAVIAAEISPIAAGTVYCVVISICGELAELRRAQEWTRALDAWCGRQQDMVTFTGRCLVHRAELLHLHGHWPQAAQEAERACQRLVGAPDAFATGAARYRQAEIHRVRGDLAAAEQAYRQASDWGYEACPGLALLRMAQGNVAAAQAAMHRACGETTDALQLARLLPAQVDIALSAGQLATARAAADELSGTAERYPVPALRAAASFARGSVLLAEGEPAAALAALRTAASLWRELEVPYEVARVREMVAMACRALGDHDTAALELDAAARAFDGLGARPDHARAAALQSAPATASHGLTGRELQVLRLVATGRTNKAIAAELALSDKTVERHLSNLFTKLGVSSRAGANGYAYQHGLV